MNPLTEQLRVHWFAATLLVLSLFTATSMLVGHRRSATWSLPLGLLTAGLALFGVGGLLRGSPLAWWLAAGSVTLLFLLVFIMVLTGYWSRLLGYALLGMLVAGVGGMLADR